MVGEVSPDKAEAQSNEGRSEHVYGVLWRLMVLGYQNRSNKQWQSLKAIHLGRMGARLPAFQPSQPCARLMVVKTTLTARFAKAA